MGSNIDSPNILTNGAILIISTIIKHVMSSAAEAEKGSVFLNAKEATILRTTLEQMGHQQNQPHNYKLTTLQKHNTVMTQVNRDAHVL
jgi:hypothetical protein